MMDTVTDPRVVLLRHGETEWSRSGRHTGRTDVPLTPDGEAAARRCGPLLATLRLRDPLVIASPRERAQRTAELAGLAIDRVWDDLSEWDYGEYEGCTTAEIRQRVPHWTVWTHPCPQGETAEAIGSRADMVTSVALGRLARCDVILVGHGHFSRVLIARWVRLPVAEGRRFAMSAGAVTVLGFEHDVRTILSHNVAQP